MTLSIVKIYETNLKTQFFEYLKLSNDYNRPILNIRKPLACDISNITFCIAKPKNNFIIFTLNKLYGQQFLFKNVNLKINKIFKQS